MEEQCTSLKVSVDHHIISRWHARLSTGEGIDFVNRIVTVLVLYWLVCKLANFLVLEGELPSCLPPCLASSAFRYALCILPAELMASVIVSAFLFGL